MIALASDELTMTVVQSTWSVGLTSICCHKTHTRAIRQCKTVPQPWPVTQSHQRDMVTLTVPHCQWLWLCGRCQSVSLSATWVSAWAIFCRLHFREARGKLDCLQFWSLYWLLLYIDSAVSVYDYVKFCYLFELWPKLFQKIHRTWVLTNTKWHFLTSIFLNPVFF